jgi:hypothetical protein
MISLILAWKLFSRASSYGLALIMVYNSSNRWNMYICTCQCACKNPSLQIKWWKKGKTVTGNRISVSRVTGGHTVHYTITNIHHLHKKRFKLISWSHTSHLKLTNCMTVATGDILSLFILKFDQPRLHLLPIFRLVSQVRSCSTPGVDFTIIYEQKVQEISQKIVV